MSISFLRRKKQEPEAPPPPPVEDVEAREYSERVTLMGRSSDALRLPAGPATAAALPSIVEAIVPGRVDVIEPLPLDLANASPAMERFNELQQWVVARRDLGPVGRHGLWVLELIDALDMTVDTFYCALLHGETDTSGYPEYQAIVGGLASHWDELSGELIVRAVVGWGGRGLRGRHRSHRSEGPEPAPRAAPRLRARARPGRGAAAARGRANGPQLHALRLPGGRGERHVLPALRHADEPNRLRAPVPLG